MMPKGLTLRIFAGILVATSAVSGAPIIVQDSNSNTMSTDDASLELNHPENGALSLNTTHDGMPIRWAFAPMSESCSATCARAGQTCLAGTWPILSAAQFTVVSGIACSIYQAGTVDQNPTIENNPTNPPNSCFWQGISSCTLGASQSQRRLCPCNNPPPPPPQLFRCTNNQCLFDPFGVPLATCLALCGFDDASTSTSTMGMSKKVEPQTDTTEHKPDETLAEIHSQIILYKTNSSAAAATASMNEINGARSCSWPSEAWNQPENTYVIFNCVMAPGFLRTLVRHYYQSTNNDFATVSYGWCPTQSGCGAGYRNSECVWQPEYVSGDSFPHQIATSLLNAQTTPIICVQHACRDSPSGLPCRGIRSPTTMTPDF